jgi:uncharacterized protein (DUF58 family)
MPEVHDYLTPEDLASVDNLQVLARTVVEGFTSGLHRSPHKGSSVEFKQHRQYVPGDDLRNLDWKVFGKSDKFFIREYEEETNLRATLLLDASGSMGFSGVNPSSGGVSKHHYATRLAASLAYLLLSQQDSVGLVTFDDAVRSYVPPRGRPNHVRVLIDEMARTEVGGETDLAQTIRLIAPKLARRGMVILISDCFAPAADLLRGLAQFRHARHEVLIFQVWHRDELEFPMRGWRRFDSLENDAKLMLDPAAVRKSYLENLDAYRAELKQGCARHRVDLVECVTDQPYADALTAYVKQRQGVRRR